MRKITALLAAILALMLPLYSPGAAWFGAHQAKAAQQANDDYYYYAARAVYNANTEETLMVRAREWTDDDTYARYAQIVAERLDEDGQRIGAPIDSLTVEIYGERVLTLELAHDPAKNKYLLIIASRDETVNICGAQAEFFVLCGMWLNADGSQDGSPFVINAETGVFLDHDNLKLAYDTAAERFVLAYVLSNYSGGYELRVALIDQNGGVAYEETIHDTSGFYYGIEIVYEESEGRFLVVMTDSNNEEILGKYVYVNPGAQQPLVADASPWPTGGSGNEAVLARGGGRTVMLWKTNEKLSVTEVTYGSGPSLSADILTGSNLSNAIRDPVMVYNPGSELFTIAWVHYTNEFSPLIFRGVHLNRDLTVAKEYPHIDVIGSGFYPDMILIPHAGAGHELLVYYTSGGESGTQVVKFGARLKQFLASPKIIYHPQEGAHYLMSIEPSFTIINDNPFFTDQLNVDKLVGKEAKRESLGSLTINIGGGEFFRASGAMDCCDPNNRFLVVWDEIDQNDIRKVMGLWFAADGPLGIPFEIDQGGFAPTVKYDPERGGFSVVYYKELPNDNVQITAKLVKNGDAGGTPLALSGEIENIFYEDPPPILLSYDPDAKQMAAVWYEWRYDGSMNNLFMHVQYFEPGGAVSSAWLGSTELAPVSGISIPYHDIERAFAVYDESAGLLRIIWDKYEEDQNYNARFYMQHLIVEKSEEALAFVAPDTVEVPPFDFFIREPIYDAGEKSVILYGMEFLQDGSAAVLKFKLSDLLSPGGNEPVLLWQGGSGVHFGELATAYDPVKGRSSVFYTLNNGSNTFAHGLIENIPLSEVLRGLDGDEGSISVADILIYIRTEQLTDRQTIRQLLDLIEPVYEPVSGSP